MRLRCLFSEEALKRIGLWAAASRKVRRVAGTSEAAAAVQEKQADLAVVYRSDLARFKKIKQAMAFPGHSYLPILYFGMPTSAARHPKAAAAFLTILASQQSADIWIANEFSPAPKELP